MRADGAGDACGSFIRERPDAKERIKAIIAQQGVAEELKMARIQLVLREQSCCVGSLQKLLGPTCACACSCAMYTRGVPVVLDGTGSRGHAHSQALPAPPG